MGKQFLTFICLACIIASSAAVKVQLFDSAAFLGPYLTSTNAEGCANLNTSNFIQEGRSLKTDTCIMLFKDVDCTSFNIRVDPGEYPDLALVKHETVNFVNPLSYRLCSGGEGGSDVNVDIYGSARDINTEDPPYEGILLKYRDICDCVNLPTKQPYVGTVKRIHNFGNCITIYSQINCTGTGVKLLGGVSPQSSDLTPLGSFIIPSSSIGPCEHRPTCHSLNQTVFKFEISSDEQKVREMSTAADLAMTAKITFRNNGTATQTQVYEASKTVEEIIEVSRATKFSSTNTYSTVRSVSVSGSVGGLWLRTKVSSTLTEAYTRTENTEETNGEKFTSKESRTVKVQQQIEIPPCSIYDVDSYVTMVTNHPVDYKVYSYVSGMSNGRPLNAEEIKERLTDGMSFEEIYDDYTVIASGVGSLLADYSMEAVIDGEGSPMEGCVAP